MKRLLIGIFMLTLAVGLQAKSHGKFVSVDGTNLIQPNGERLFIRGTNLGNWLNPEGYMFGFSKTNSAWMIDQMLRELVGPDETDAFWQEFKDNYITEDDIAFIAARGANTIRLPLNYKLFTDEDYMGLKAHQDGLQRIDQVVEWCRKYHLYLILDMHDCPGSQTGDNIDDGYGYPWLFESERSQQLLADIWQQIARRYKNEPVILGYELMNEPIAHYFEADKARLNAALEPLYKRLVAAIRSIDPHHIILLGGAQWNSAFDMFHDWTFAPNLMYTCHRYGGDATSDAIRSFIDFRDRTGLPMYMGELGHNTDEWQRSFAEVMERENIGYTYWPYKKVDGSCMMAVDRPELWDSLIVRFSEADRATYSQIREARPSQEAARKVLHQYLENIKCRNCHPQESYIESMRLR